MKELKSMVDVHAQEESMVQRLRLGDGQVPEDKIQEKLDEVFKGQAGKMNSFNSFNSLLVSRSNISLEPQLREKNLKGLSEDTK